MKTRYLAPLLLLDALLAIACTAQARSPEPVPVDRVECARCRMLISNDKGGGQIISPHDDTRFYDDIGCLAADWTSHPGGARAYVRTSGGRWRDAASVSYAQPAGVETPMASGFAAFDTPEEARSADRTNRVLTFDDVLHQIGGSR
jgi:hypothetical protein